MKIILCLPGKTFSNVFLLSLIQLVRECQESGIDLAVINSYSPIVAFARNSCLGGNPMLGQDQKPFGGKIEYDYMLWVDSDIIFNIVSVKKLILAAQNSGDCGIVSGVYKMSDNKHFAVSRYFSSDYMATHGSYEFLTDENMPKVPFIADGIGLGFCIIKNGVIEKLKYPWFRYREINIFPVYDILSEDFSFCEAARLVSSILVDPSIRVGHEKTVIL